MNLETSQYHFKELLLFMSLEKVSEYIKKNRLYITMVFFMMIAIYGAWAFTDYVSFDAEGLYSMENSAFWYDQWTKLGRWSLVVLKKILGVWTINPFFTITFFLILFPLSSLMWSYAMNVWAGAEKESCAGRVVFDLLYMTCPIWAHQFAYRNQMEVISVLMVILPLSVLLLTKWLTEGGKNNTCWMLLAFCGVVFCFSGYQSFVILYVNSVMLYFLLQIIAAKIERKTFYIRLGKVLAFTAVAYFVYSYSCKLICSVFHIDRAGYNKYLLGQIPWGKLPFNECLHASLSASKKMVVGDGVTYTSVLVGEVIIAMFLLLLYWIKKGNLRVWATLITGLLFVWPFALTILTAGTAVHRQHFSLAFSIAGIGVIEINAVFRLLKRRRSELLGIILCTFLTICAVVPQLQLHTRLQYSQIRAAEKDIVMMEQLIDEAFEKGAQEWDSLVLVGGYTFCFDTAMAREEATGISYFEINPLSRDKVIDAMQAYGLPVTEPTPDQIAFGEARAAELPCWPDKASVIVENHVIVIRLS